MSSGNGFVAAVLRSPLHRLLSGSTDLIRYEGRRSGREITTPTQYAQLGDDLVILVGHPERKTWWHNFETEHDIDVLVRRQWRTMAARAMSGADEPDAVTPLLDAYLDRFPNAAASLGDGTREDQVRRAVIVHCQPRPRR
ncbi:MAG: nitroreductase/quinone reductase family protein [Acidimicrobiales bacterium]